jgi:hypothetical protein
MAHEEVSLAVINSRGHYHPLCFQRLKSFRHSLFFGNTLLNCKVCFQDNDN